MSNVAEVELHVIAYPFGRYGVIAGRMISTVPLTLDQARRLAAGDDDEVASEVMREKCEALRARRSRLYRDRANLQKEILELEQTAGKLAAYQLRLRQRALTKCEQALQAVLNDETELQHAESDVNKMQRRAALAGEPTSATAGIVVACAELVIAGVRYHRGAVIGDAAVMQEWLPANRQALLANKLVEVRPASAPAA